MRAMSRAFTTILCAAAISTNTSFLVLLSFACASRTFDSAAWIFGLNFIASAISASKLSGAGAGFCWFFCGSEGFAGWVGFGSSGFGWAKAEPASIVRPVVSDRIISRVRIARSPFSLHDRQPQVIVHGVERWQFAQRVAGVQVAAHGAWPVLNARVCPTGVKKKSAALRSIRLFSGKFQLVWRARRFRA